MAKKSMIAREAKRQRTIAKYADKRKALKAIIKDRNSTPRQIADAVAALASLPRDSSPVRLTTRCAVTGRPRAVYRKFGLSRNMVRHLGNLGELPGLVKSSW